MIRETAHRFRFFMIVVALPLQTEILSAETGDDTEDPFLKAENVGYCDFILEKGENGLRAEEWGGVHASYLNKHTMETENDNRNHRVATESTSLLAQLALLRGDQETLDEMLEIWTDENRHFDPTFQITHWLLDEQGNKIPTSQGFLRNASGEEARMLEVLTKAYERFGDPRYRNLAQDIADGMIGVGAQGVFEPVCRGRESRFETFWMGRSLDVPISRWQSRLHQKNKDNLSASENDASDFLLRSWFEWDEAEMRPVSTCSDPPHAPLNVNNFIGYHKVADMFNLPFYENVIDHTISTIHRGQHEITGIYWPQYNLLKGEYEDEENNNECTVLACADIATRMHAYIRESGNEDSMQEVLAGTEKYYKFLECQYRNDGILWRAHDRDTGLPVGKLTLNETNLGSYVFLAKMAIEFRDWSLAEKIFREQVLPRQVLDQNHPSFVEPGYRGSFKTQVNAAQSRANYYDDALAFDNLETLIALNLWNNSDKGSWRSSYPVWTTAASEELTSPPGEAVTTRFDSVSTRYLRIVGLERGSDFGYSIVELEILDQNGQGIVLSDPEVSVSSSQNFMYLGRHAVDGDENTRWSSLHRMDPQWIYINLGQEHVVSGVKILWEQAFAARYDVQVGSQTSSCAATNTALCLNNDRFIVEVEWRDFNGNTGEGQVVPVESDDSGLFYFFAPDNWEMLVKVLDGCGITNHFWVFAAATTNVEYTLRVTDTESGDFKEYFNPLGTSAAAITDTEALAVCSRECAGAMVGSERVVLTQPPEGVLTREINGQKQEVCMPGASNLCLNNDRFIVEVEWRDFNGNTGEGQVVPVESDDSGLFYFFAPDNWEMLVKVLDGCSITNHFWVFAAATTNVEYTLHVTDTETEEKMEYFNPLGTSAAAITDTRALPVCQ